MPARNDGFAHCPEPSKKPRACPRPNVLSKKRLSDTRWVRTSRECTHGQCRKIAVGATGNSIAVGSTSPIDGTCFVARQCGCKLQGSGHDLDVRRIHQRGVSRDGTDVGRIELNRHFPGYPINLHPADVLGNSASTAHLSVVGGRRRGQISLRRGFGGHQQFRTLCDGDAFRDAGPDGVVPDRPAERPQPECR